MKAVCIAGWSDSGKTTLIERLIPLLMGRGLRVGVVKHTHHSLSMDQHGSDTDRYRGSGAAAVVLAAPDGTALLNSCPMNLAQTLALMPDMDLILVEGFKHEEIAKIVLFRDGAGHRPEELVIDRHVIAVASDVPLNLDVALLDINDVEGLADFVVEWMQKQDG